MVTSFTGAVGYRTTAPLICYRKRLRSERIGKAARRKRLDAAHVYFNREMFTIVLNEINIKKYL